LPSVLEAFQAVAPNLSSTSTETRLVALEALRHLAERAPDIYRNQYPNLFEAPLADSSREVRWRAAWAKGRLLESSPALRAAALDRDELVAEAACEALGAAHDDQALPVLVRALDRAGPVSKAASAALTRATGREFPDAEGWKTYIRSRENQRSGTAPVGS
ncbi:MAG: HEAT repeat domain-containing protein, partial [Planctomycetota bacterium]